MRTAIAMPMRTRKHTRKMPKPLVPVLALAACLLFTVGTAVAQQSRPAITGISHMCVYASDAAAADHFYAHLLGATKGADPQNPQGTRYYLSFTQFVDVLQLPADHILNRMAC